MSNTKLVSNFLLKVEPEQAKRIDEFRWANRERSPAAAVRKLLDLGLAAAKQDEKAA
jgi:hypothetical protein